MLAERPGQRAGLAKRLQAESGKTIELPGYTFREADGYSAAHVRVIAALKNIGEDSGSALDAAKVLGASDDFLADKPLFSDVAKELLEYLAGAEVIIHNADFDVGFLDAELKRLGISSGEGVARAELGIKDKLGMGGLNVDLMRLLLQDQQFGDRLGLDTADREAFWNNAAMQYFL